MTQKEMFGDCWEDKKAFDAAEREARKMLELGKIPACDYFYIVAAKAQEIRLQLIYRNNNTLT